MRKCTTRTDPNIPANLASSTPRPPLRCSEDAKAEQRSSLLACGGTKKRRYYYEMELDTF